MGHYPILWETNRGCPFRCTFCDWGSNTAAKVTKFELDRLYQEVDWFQQNNVDYIFCCDANFGMLKRDVEIAQYIADVKSKYGNPRTVFVQSTKNATERAYETQRILHEAGLGKGVALSMQSMDAHTLENIKRDNISLETYWEMQRRFSKIGVETYTDLIIGLPGETYDSFADGVDLLISQGQHNRINIQNLAILPNAEMGVPEYIKSFGMELVKSKIGVIHGSNKELDDDVLEEQELVIATDSMGREDWVRARVYGYIAGLFMFDKLCQLPIIIAHKQTGINYRNILEGIAKADEDRFPIVREIVDSLQDTAESIQQGGPVFQFSKKFLGINWHPNEIVFMRLFDEGMTDQFYEEFGRLLQSIIVGNDCDPLDDTLLDDALLLNRSLFKYPFVDQDLELDLTFNVWSFYKSIRQGDLIDLVRENERVLIDRTSEQWHDFDQWCREVVWYAYTKGAYFYPCTVIDPSGKESKNETEERSAA